MRTGFRQGTDPLYRHLGQSGVPAETVGLFAAHPAGAAGRVEVQGQQCTGHCAGSFRF